MAEAAKWGSSKAFNNYLDIIQNTLSDGYASEGSHYPALKALLESLIDGITATNLPNIDANICGICIKVCPFGR